MILNLSGLEYDNLNQKSIIKKPDRFQTLPITIL